MQQFIGRMICVPGIFLLCATGCEDLELPFPTGAESETTESTDAQETPASDSAASSEPAPDPTPAPPPKPTVESVLAAIKAKPSVQITDQDLLKLNEVEGGLEAITELNLKGARLSSAGLQVIASLPALKRLDLEGGRVPDAHWQGLSGATGLEWLSLKESSLSNLSAEALSGLTSLKSLNIAGTRVTDIGFEHFVGLSSLEEVYLGGLKIDGSGMKAFGKDHANAPIRLISAGNTSFGVLGFVHVKDFEGLEELYAGNASVTDASLAGVKRLTTLRRVGLGGNPLVSDAGLKLLNKSRDLVYLELNGVKRISNATLKAFSKHTSLKQLLINDSACTIEGVRKFKESVPGCLVRLNNKEY